MCEAYDVAYSGKIFYFDMLLKVTGFPLYDRTCCNCIPIAITLLHFSFGHSTESLFQTSHVLSEIKTEAGCQTTAQTCL